VTELVLIVFAIVYLGMALGRLPGLSLDRTGVAILGAIGLYAAGAVSAPEALAAIDFPTLFILFGLMIVSAQFAACGFYDWCAARIAGSGLRPAAMLAITVGVSGALSAVLANDVVVYAMTPMLCAGLVRRGLDARPFLIGLVGAANAGSAATVIGNPQNILIGEVGRLDFWQFLIACGPPALFALAVVYAVVWLIWRRALGEADRPPAAEPPPLDRAGLWKGVAATALLLALFATSLPRATSVLIVAGLLLVSRRLATRRILGHVDWHLLALFAGLFVVTQALAATALPQALLRDLVAAGLTPDRTAVLAPIALVGSNVIGNVPAVVLLLSILPPLPEGVLYGLALLTTLAGNLLIVGSIANIIVVERARASGVELGFLAHARSGVPMTLISLAAAAAWLVAGGWMAW
jgi:Na+/H+ antiporter NhaD/arsenite permease-like protein